MEIREMREKQTFRREDSYFKPFSTTLLVGVMVLLVLFSCSLASAWDFDNIKEFDKIDEFGQDLEYGKITIYNAFGLPLIGDKLAEYTLEDNTDQCLINCHAEGTAKLYSTGQLFSDLIFYNRRRVEKSLKDSKILIEVTESYELEIPDYYKVCEEVTNEINESVYQDCQKTIIGSHKETRYKTFWKDYNGEVLELGDYRWRIEAKKNIGESIDWIGSAFGESFTEWEWWDEDWTKKRLLSNLAGDIIYIDLNYTNFTGALANWSDLRFVDATETTEYEYFLQKKVDSANATFRIRSFNAASLYIYYDNDAASSNSDIEDVYGTGLMAMYFFDETTGVIVDSSVNQNNGTNNGADRGIAGVIGNAFDFEDGDPDYGQVPEDTTLNATSALTIAVWVKLEQIKNYQVPFGKRSGADEHYQMTMPGDAKVYLETNPPFGGWSTDAIMSAGIWTHAVIAFDTTNVTFYINNSLAKTVSTGVSLNYNVHDLMIGRDGEVGTNYFDGIIDEGGLWNRKLNATEVGWLYNTQEPVYVLGAEEIPFVAPTVNLNTPVDNANLTSSSVTFNGTVYDDGGIVNVSLILNGVYNETNSSGVNNSNYIFTKTISDGEHNWTYEACDDGDKCTTATTRTFEIDTIYPTVNVTSPTGNQGWFVTGISLDLNWTALDTNLDSCWYQYNGANTTLTCGNNYTTFNVTNKSDVNLTFYVNDTFGWLNVTDVSWFFSLALENESYNNETWETKLETFQVNVTIRTGYTIYSVQFVYNNTNYTISDIQTFGETYQLTRTIDIPLNAEGFANQTNPFFWRFILVDSEENQETQELPEDNQTSAFINLQLCNATYSTSALNFTYKDEFTKTQIDASVNATNIGTTFFYWLGSGDVQKNYSYENLSNSDASNYEFCIYPYDYTFRTDMDMEYEAEDYSPRTYYLRNATLTNVTNNIDLMLLLIDYSVKFFVTVKRGEDLFTDAIVSISKYFTEEGRFRAIGTRRTDDRGRFIEYFDIDKNFQFSFVKDGVSYGVIERWVTCMEAPCELDLQIEEAEIDLWEGYYDTFAQNIAYTLIYNDTTGIITFVFTDLTGLAQYFQLVVEQTKYNVTDVVICDETTYTTFGTLTCNISSYEGYFTAYTYVSRSPRQFLDYLKLVRQTVKDIFGATGILIAFFIIVTIALVGAWNPAVGVALTALSVFAVSAIGFVALGQFAVISIIVLAVIIIIKMKV